MIEQRLTAETARVGMRVRCVDADGDFHANQLVEGQTYTVKGRREPGSDIWLEGIRSSWQPSRFVPADPETAPSLRAILSARAPELLDAISVFHKAWGIGERHSVAFKSIRELLNAIERAGLLVPPEPPRPRTTEREATISEGWWT